MKTILITLLLACSLLAKAQLNPDDIYKVTILQTIQKDSVKRTDYMTIDSAGNIYVNQKLLGQVNLEKFNSAVRNFMNKEKMTMVEANNDPPAEERIPKNNTKNIFLRIIKQSDFKKDKAYYHPTTYWFFKLNISLNDFEFPFFNYLIETDKKKIVDLLK